MARRADGVALGRSLIRGPMAWILSIGRLLMAATCLMHTGSFIRHGVQATDDVTRLTHLLPALWTLVSAYMAYCIIDESMIRWIVTYSNPAAVFRAVVSIVLYAVIVNLMTAIDNNPVHQFTIWILISSGSTVAYIFQSFVASNLAHQARERTLNLFRIAVYAVIPIGLASFLSLFVLIRILLLVQYDTRYVRGVSGWVFKG